MSGPKKIVRLLLPTGALALSLPVPGFGQAAPQSLACAATPATASSDVRSLNAMLLHEGACGRLTEARAAGQRALALPGLTRPERLQIEASLALLLLREGRAAQAATALRTVADQQSALDLPGAATASRINLAAALWRSDRLEEAVSVLRAAAGQALPALQGLARTNLAVLELATLRHADALATARAAVAAGDQATTPRAELLLGIALQRSVTWQDAEEGRALVERATGKLLATWPRDGSPGPFEAINKVPVEGGMTAGVEPLAGDDEKTFADRAREQVRRSPAAAEHLAGLDVVIPIGRRLGRNVQLASDLADAADLAEAAGAKDTALARRREAVALQLAMFDVDPVNRDTLADLAAKLRAAGATADADALQARMARAPAALAAIHKIDMTYYADRRGPPGNLALNDQALKLAAGYPGTDSTRYADQLNWRAVFLAEAGKPAEALTALQQSLEIDRARLGPRSDAVYRQLVFQADLLEQAGRHGEAADRLAELVRIGASSDGDPDRALESHIHVLVATGRGKEALGWATRRLEAIERTRQLSASQDAHGRELAASGIVPSMSAFVPLDVDARLDRARVLLVLGHHAKARGDAEAAFARLSQNDKPATLDMAEAHVLLGQAKLAGGDAAGAAAEAEAARALLAGPVAVDTFIGNAAAVLGVRAKLANPGLAAGALATIAPLVAAARADHGAEALPLPSPIDAANGAVSRNDLFALELDSRWAATGPGHDVAAAFDAAQRALSTPASQAVAQAAGRRLAASGNPALGQLAREREDLVGLYLAADRQLASASAGEDGEAEGQRAAAQASKQAIAARFAAIDEQLRGQAPAYFALVRQEPLASAQAQAVLRDDEAVLMVVPGEFGTHLFAITKTGVTWQRAGWNRERVANAVRRLLWFAGANVDASDVEIATWTAEVGGGENGFDRPTAHALYGQIVAPLEPALAGHRRVFVVGGGALSSLPFAMLVAAPPEGSDDDPAALRATRWFGDAHALTQLPSLQSLAMLRGGSAGAAPTAPGFVGFGDPVLDAPVPAVVEAGSRGAGRGRGRLRGGAPVPADIVSFRGGGAVPIADPAELRGLKRIPGTAIEVAAMAKVLSVPQDRLFLGASDREATFRASPLLREATIVSLATHGLLGGSLSSVAEPGLVFTPPAAPGPADDGYLTTSEVAALSLRADWVILSACNTAAGDGTAGAPGLSGLARAFFHAGARNLLVSNWPVRDDVAPSLTVGAVERALKDPSLSRAEALQQAVKAVRDNPVADATKIDGISQTWAHPSAWAPFSLVGDGR